MCEPRVFCSPSLPKTGTHRNLWPHYDCNFSVFWTSHIYSPATGKVRAVTIFQAVNFDRLDGALLLVSGAVSMTRNTKIADVYLSQRIVLTFAMKLGAMTTDWGSVLRLAAAANASDELLNTRESAFLCPFGNFALLFQHWGGVFVS